ncbi:MAG: hypothetical protein U5K54_01950 [Cytophagales bacterium]|nr:hypothetical protein [Cytophagales bacterium]
MSIYLPGRGYIAQLLETGAEVKAYDLFPNQNQFYKSTVNPIDLQKSFHRKRFRRPCYLL